MRFLGLTLASSSTMASAAVQARGSMSRKAFMTSSWRSSRRGQPRTWLAIHSRRIPSKDHKSRRRNSTESWSKLETFKTQDEAIKLGNNTSYGLAAAVHTQNITRAITVSNALKAGTVWVNSYNMLHHQLPFGGYKESGIGRELGEAALDNYTQTKTVSIRLGDALFG